MAGSIADFKASFDSELARPNRFDVQVPIPLGMIPYIGVARSLTFRCENAELPGRAISTTSMKVYNIEEKFPYQTTFNDISLTFLVMSDMKEKLFFDAWLDWINPSLNFNMKYKNDYAVTLCVNQYDLHNKLTYSVDLYDAFPTSINAMPLDWQSDGYHKLTVNFAYTRWKNNSLESVTMDAIENAIAYTQSILTNSNLGRDLASFTELSPLTQDVGRDVY